MGKSKDYHTWRVRWTWGSIFRTPQKATVIHFINLPTRATLTPPSRSPVPLTLPESSANCKQCWELGLYSWQVLQSCLGHTYEKRVGKMLEAQTHAHILIQTMACAYPCYSRLLPSGTPKSSSSAYHGEYQVIPQVSLRGRFQGYHFGYYHHPI